MPVETVNFGDVLCEEHERAGVLLADVLLDNALSGDKKALNLLRDWVETKKSTGVVAQIAKRSSCAEVRATAVVFDCLLKKRRQLWYRGETEDLIGKIDKLIVEGDDAERVGALILMDVYFDELDQNALKHWFFILAFDGNAGVRALNKKVQSRETRGEYNLLAFYALSHRYSDLKKLGIKSPNLD